MFRRGRLGRRLGRGLGRGYQPVGQPRRPLPPDMQQALVEANRLKDGGHYTEAAKIFEKLAGQAGANHMPRRAALYTIQDGHCRLLAKQPDAGIARMRQGLEMLAANGNWQALDLAGHRIIAQLEQLGYTAQAAEIRQWLGQALPSGMRGPQPAAPAPAPRLPAKCPNCGASIRSDAVEWIDATSAECPYCGSNVSAEV